MTKIWQILSQSAQAGKNPKFDIVDVLLKNRGIKDGREFFSPKDPAKIKIEEVGIKKLEVTKAIKRIKQAIKKKEKIIIYGDYDADGVCATAILWEALYNLYKNVLPYIPERFSEGYGLNIKSIQKLKKEDDNLKLIITVDNGIVANEAVEAANKLGIDVIVTDHHLPRLSKTGKLLLPSAHSLIHSTLIGGAAVAWFFAKELVPSAYSLMPSLELAAIGTLADQIPLSGINRSIVKFGLKALNTTKRAGLATMIADAALKPGEIGTYEVGFVLAPRINAMGRLEHAIESLRLLCTKDSQKASELSKKLSRVNAERQKIVEEVVTHTLRQTQGKPANKIIVIAHESYHEGVIGLAAGKLVEEFYRPAIVISKGEKLAKASARSISGFNIIEAIRSVEHLIIQGGGHPMAAGFTIESSKIEEFETQINKVSDKLLNEEVMQRKLKIDLEIKFDQINLPRLAAGKAGWALAEKLQEFEPTGLGNPIPTFCSREVEVIDARVVGADGKHLKLKLKQGNTFFGAIAFGFGELLAKITPDTKIDIAYAIEVNSWNGSREIQLKVKDISIA